MSKLVILVGLILFACSSPKKQGDDNFDAAEAARAPEWVFAPNSQCASREICAVGEGQNMEEADARAKKALASVFSTTIESHFEIQKTSVSAKEFDELKEMATERINQKVDETLTNTQIKKRHQGDGLFYSMATLDKPKTAQIFLSRIKELDGELALLKNRGNRSSVKRMLAILEERSGLADQLVVVDVSAPKSPVGLEQIERLKTPDAERSLVGMRHDASAPPEIAQDLESLLGEVGFKLTREDSADYVVEMKFSATEARLNVRGFKKFVFVFEVRSLNAQNQQIGSFATVTTETGRSQKDAWLKARQRLAEDMEKRLHKLNLP